MREQKRNAAAFLFLLFSLDCIGICVYDDSKGAGNKQAP